MKKIIYLISFILALSYSSMAQNGKLKEKMIEYIQQKLSMSRDEAVKFEPLFTNYLKDLASTNQQYKGDRLVLQDKIVELRLRYRNEFKPVLGEKRSNDVFNYERDFVKEVQTIRQERLQSRPDGRATKRF